MIKVLHLRNNTRYNLRQSFVNSHLSLYKIDLFDFVNLITMRIKDWILSCLIISQLPLLVPVISYPAAHYQYKFPKP
jgi:hypothetical protein